MSRQPNKKKSPVKKAMTRAWRFSFFYSSDYYRPVLYNTAQAPFFPKNYESSTKSNSTRRRPASASSPPAASGTRAIWPFVRRRTQPGFRKRGTQSSAQHRFLLKFNIRGGRSGNG